MARNNTRRGGFTEPAHDNAADRRRKARRRPVIRLNPVAASEYERVATGGREIGRRADSARPVIASQKHGQPAAPLPRRGVAQRSRGISYAPSGPRTQLSGCATTSAGTSARRRTSRQGGEHAGDVDVAVLDEDACTCPASRRPRCRRRRGRGRCVSIVRSSNTGAWQSPRSRDAGELEERVVLLVADQREDEVGGDVARAAAVAVRRRPRRRMRASRASARSRPGTVLKCASIRPVSIRSLISGSSQYLMLFSGSRSRR